MALDASDCSMTSGNKAVLEPLRGLQQWCTQERTKPFTSGVRASSIYGDEEAHHKREYRRGAQGKVLAGLPTRQLSE